MEAAVETIELSSSSSESEVTVGDTTVKPRPKLSTRRNKAVDQSDEHSPDSPDVARPAKRRRETSKQIQYIEDIEDQEEEEEEAEADEDATEDYVDQVETPSEDEKMPEEDPNRRRSGRKRKAVQSVIDLSDDDFVMSSDEEEEKSKSKVKPKKKEAKDKAKEKRKRSSSDFGDDTEVKIIERVTPEVDGFIIDKVLAREAHTQKEWKKICWNKNTRFLTHCSIFLPPEEEEKEKQEEKKETQEQKEGENSASVAPSEPKVSVEDDEAEDAGEERFLVKWKTLSYLHTSWQTEEELLETDKNAKGKIQRFREKELRAFYSQAVQGDEYFNPEFRSVDRILEIRDRPLDDFSPDDTVDGESNFQYFLVKWKALPYDEISWEREDDVGDDAAVEQYNDRIVRAAKRFKKIALAKHLPPSKRKNFRGYTAESRPPCRKEQTFQLRDYQLTGVNWMLFNWYQKRNSMLADEMGLGKTVQTVMYINHLAVVERTPQPFIIVAPLSTLGHWQREFDSWTNLNAVVYHGSAAAREVLQNYEFFMSEDELLRVDELTRKDNNGKRAAPQPKRNCYRFDVLITTYEMASATDLYKLAQINWQLMVVDEAHRLKNRNSKLSNILHTRFTYENMLLLTGTPLQNNVEELWVLLNFLDTKKFASKESFLESFGELTDSAQVERLHSELKPYLLRRMKEDVEKSLAPKEETIIEVELTVLQKQYYRAIYEKNTEFLSRGGRKGDTPSLMNVLMELRKCCNHPFLVKGVEEREVKRLAKQANVSKEEIQRQISESLVDTSGKLVLLDKLLPRLKETGHRVLIFSQFKIMLDIIQDYLALRRYNCERIDGNITGNERQSAIDRFCREDSNSFIMLLSTRAGGVGINLTAADTVIIYDSDWNPQNDLQAQARCHRIGQKKSVKIYRLLTAKTYELHMFHKASLKLGLDQAVLGGIKSDDSVAKLKGAAKTPKTNDRMSKEEIENLLKHGAYEMFKEQDSEAEAASKKFGEESIDQILSRSTTIVHDPTRDVDGKEKKNAMSSFSKATFVSSTNPDEEVDVDDPNFWTKVIGLNGVEEQKKVEPSPLQKRRCRRKVKSYLIDDDKAFMMDSGDEAASTKKKLFRELGVQKDEEFVMSEDDDDDDDSSDVAFANDDLSDITTNGKRKRSKTPALPIHYHTERIAELLGSFGYGRWDDMKRHAPALQAYSDKELIKFAQDYLTGMVRVTTAMAAFARIGLDLEPSRVYIVSTSVPPQQMANASPIERYASELNSSLRRYHFLAPMLKDMRIANLLAVAVPPRLWVTDFKSRAARGFRAKLQQIDTMSKLSEFVRLKLVQVPPLVSLLKDLQKVGDKAEVHRMIESDILPERADVIVVEEKDAAPVEEKPEETAAASSEQVTAVGSSDNKDSTKNEEGSATTDSKDTSENDGGSTAADQNQLETSSAPAKSAEVKSEKVVSSEPAGSKTSTNAVNKEETAETPTASASTTSEDPSEKTGTAATVSDATRGKEGTETTDSPTSSGGKSDKSVSVGAPNSESKFSFDKSEVEKKHDESTADAQSAEQKTQPKDDAAATKEKTDAAAAKDKTERKQAMRILQSLAPVNSAEPVAPWWISRVDDVMLVLYVYRDGWLKGRTLPSRMVDSTTLFGDRAKRYPIAEWPSLANLNRRLKVVLHVWTAVKATPPIAASIATALTISSAKYQRQQEKQQQLLRLREQQRAQQARNYASTSLHSVRHNQFAKLVFSYGIPDVSTCRDKRERNEKWRYFLQDSQLEVGHHPLEELLAESLDLERVCRQRLRTEADGRGHNELSEENSILGGKRGYWLLTTTQCRRLLHRVDLFRLLRTQILVLPPAQLVDLVTRVVRAQSASTDYPAWWRSPRHDILLLQGVECYGLDDHLASVWKLPLFSSANKTTSFPSSSWVENYVTALALGCRHLVRKVRTYQNDAYVDLSKDDARASPSADRHHSRPAGNLEGETRRRIRDIRGMREEDPHFVPSVRLRQIIEKQQQADTSRETASDKTKTQRAELMAAKETVLMQLEDPYKSSRVRAVWTEQTKHDEIESTKKRSSVGPSDEKTEKSMDEKKEEKEKISTDSDDDENSEEEKSSRPTRSERPVQRPATSAVAAAKARRENSKLAIKASAQPAAPAWDVIVIGSSDDSD
ncbi:hypothetical protein PInf_026375 [Phytophthora infestans]|nr:hypothetical protein PInf_026375 [Phytophthora infestans]